jgi:hypothetical protein
MTELHYAPRPNQTRKANLYEPRFKLRIMVTQGSECLPKRFRSAPGRMFRSINPGLPPTNPSDGFADFFWVALPPECALRAPPTVFLPKGRQNRALNESWDRFIGYTSSRAIVLRPGKTFHLTH